MDREITPPDGLVKLPDKHGPINAETFAAMVEAVTVALDPHGSAFPDSPIDARRYVTGKWLERMATR